MECDSATSMYDVGNQGYNVANRFPIVFEVAPQLYNLWRSCKLVQSTQFN